MEALKLASGIGGGARGRGLDSLSKPLIRPSGWSREMSIAINKSSRGTSRRLRSGQRRGLQTLSMSQSPYRAASRWDLVSSLGVKSSQEVHLRRLTQIQHHLNSQPWTATRTISMNATNSGGPPQEESFIVKLIEKVIQCIASLLPSKAIIQKVEDEFDTVADMVKQGVEVVVEVADEIERVSNIAEAKAEEVEKLAQKVEEITEEVKKVVDDVTDVLEGEKEASSLVDTYESLKKEAENLKKDAAGTAAAASATAAAAAAISKGVEKKALSGSDDSGAAPTTRPRL